MTDLVQVEQNGKILSGHFGVDDQGNWGLLNGTVTETKPSGSYYQETMQNGYLTQVTIGHMTGNTSEIDYLIEKKQNELGIYYNSDNDELINGILKSPDNSFRVTMTNGFIEQYHAMDIDLGIDPISGRITSSTNAGLLTQIINGTSSGSGSFFDKTRRFAATIGNLMRTPTFQLPMSAQTDLSSYLSRFTTFDRMDKVQTVIDLFKNANDGFIPDIEIVPTSHDAINTEVAGLHVRVSSEPAVTFTGSTSSTKNGSIRINLETGKIEGGEYAFKTANGQFHTTAYQSFNLDDVTSSTTFSNVFSVGTGASWNWGVDDYLSSSEKIKTELKPGAISGTLRRSFSFAHELSAGSASNAWKFEIDMDNNDLRAAGTAAIGATAIMGLFAIASELNLGLGVGAAALAGIAGLLTTIRSGYQTG